MSDFNHMTRPAAPVYSAGKLAGRAGRPHTDNPHPKESYEALLWFHAWHVATVERQDGVQISAGLPEDDGSGLLMFTQRKDREL